MSSLRESKCCKSFTVFDNFSQSWLTHFAQNCRTNFKKNNLSWYCKFQVEIEFLCKFCQSRTENNDGNIIFTFANWGPYRRQPPHEQSVDMRKKKTAEILKSIFFLSCVFGTESSHENLPKRRVFFSRRGVFSRGYPLINQVEMNGRSHLPQHIPWLRKKHFEFACAK